MSSLRNAVYRRAHKERAQPKWRKSFGLLEKHKDYVVRAEAYHKKEAALQKLKEKAAFRNPDEFYFKMINTRTVNGVHKPRNQANKYTEEELMIMKTQDMGYKIERLTAVLQSTDDQLPSKHVYYAEDREDAKEMQLHNSKVEKLPVISNLPEKISGFKRKVVFGIIRVLDWNLDQAAMLRHIWSNGYSLWVKWSHKKTAASYRELEARKGRVRDLEKLYMDMAMQKELKKKGRKRKLREDEILCPTSNPVYKWRSERKR
ncbi:hypothetical protein Vadar_019098 [Vaccinium darrowii]|uniref:Uncharacterized protein n=1 Tax=Vaccinium darrowii TaxID=229202 RepID=A0ACB7Y800_9ERIC|nr:hypothetical protein Vadar_019098 [Vaccinium darrowii]